MGNYSKNWKSFIKYVGLLIFQYHVVVILDNYLNQNLVKFIENTCILGFIVPVNIFAIVAKTEKKKMKIKLHFLFLSYL